MAQASTASSSGSAETGAGSGVGEITTLVCRYEEPSQLIVKHSAIASKIAS
jgi:hypothetical protein